MTTKNQERRGRATTSRRVGMAWHAAVLALLAGCSVLGPPPMEPLTTTTLEAARHRWEAHGTDWYRLVVQVRAPRVDPVVYEVEVAGGKLVKIERDGQSIGLEEADHNDYSMAGLFALLQNDLHWIELQPVGDTPAVDLRAYFEPESGRLVRYRRTVGTERRRVLVVEVLGYAPLPALRAEVGREPARAGT